jgi:hypothetical protein
MSEEDTILVFADLRICDGVRYEKDIITKRNDTVFIQVFIDDDFFGKVDCGRRVYNCNLSDTLNFETLYSNLQNRLVNEKNQSLTFQITHNRKDTLNLYTKGLMDILWTVGYLASIKDQIYHDKDYYKPRPEPPLPEGFSDQENLDSIQRDITNRELERILNK